MNSVLSGEGMRRWAKESGVQAAVSRLSLRTLVNDHGIKIALFTLLFVPLDLQVKACALVVIILIWAYQNFRDIRVPEANRLRFSVIYAPQDGYIAHKLVKRLARKGHGYVNKAEADITLVIFSDYTWSYTYDPESEGNDVIPLIVQTPNEFTVSRQKIFQMQGIDLRSDVSNRIDLISSHLHEREVLMDKLGILPFRTRFVRPQIVNFAEALLAGTVGFVVLQIVTSLAAAVLSQGRLTFQFNVTGAIISAIFILSAWKMVNMLRERSGSYGAFSRRFILAVIFGLNLGGAIVILLAFFTDGLQMWLPNGSKRHLPNPEKLNKSLGERMSRVMRRS